MAGWDEQVAELEAEFPGWHVWRSNAGRWWATRTGAVRAARTSEPAAS